MRGDSLHKAARLEMIETYLCFNPDGLTTKQLAEKCGVVERTIQRDMLTLDSQMGLPITRIGSKWVVASYNLKLNLDLDEAMVFLIAARLYARNCDENNPHAQTALSKLGACLPDPMKWQVQSTAASLRSGRDNPVFVKSMEDLAKGWYEQRKILVNYRSFGSGEVREHLFSPYFVEAQAVGRSTYAIGRIDAYDEVRTLKVERMASTELTHEPFVLPPEPDFIELLQSAWGVMWGDGQKAQVVLDFHQDACRTVKEALWHPSQKISDLEDGGCRLSVEIGDTREIENWILGWGQLVKVVEPEELRHKIAAELKRAAAQYD